MNIFISGASGLVGSNCLHYFKNRGANVVGSYFSYSLPELFFFDSLDIENKANQFLDKFKPTVIIHCGALTHVDYCETHEDESFQKTVLSTKNLLSLSKKFGAKFVYISTDYVFDGKHGPYDETDTTNPLCIYAKHKLMAEEMVLNNSANNLVLRVTNVYGKEERNKNFVSRIIEQCKLQKEFTLLLPTDQYATPVNAHDIARSMWLLLNDNKKGIYHIASNEYLNRVSLAEMVLSHFPDALCKIIPCTTAALNQPALRPLKGGLKNKKFMKEYPDFTFTTVNDFVLQTITT